MKLAYGPIYDAAMTLLPPRMNSIEARANLLAIALQESRCEHRRQLHNGPARGFWQFEQAGIRGVLTHRATRPHILAVLEALRYDSKDPVVDYWAAVEHNDILACCFARLNLWWVPTAIPGPDDVEGAWKQYLLAWNPGLPKKKTWPRLYAQAWQYASSL